LFFQFFKVYGHLSRRSLQYPELVCWNKHQFDFWFCTKTLIFPETSRKHEIMHGFWGKGEHTKEFFV